MTRHPSFRCGTCAMRTRPPRCLSCFSAHDGWPPTHGVTTCTSPPDAAGPFAGHPGAVVEPARQHDAAHLRQGQSHPLLEPKHGKRPPCRCLLNFRKRAQAYHPFLSSETRFEFRCRISVRSPASASLAGHHHVRAAGRRQLELRRALVSQGARVRGCLTGPLFGGLRRLSC